MVWPLRVVRTRLLVDCTELLFCYGLGYGAKEHKLKLENAKIMLDSSSTNAAIKIMPHHPPPGQGGDLNFTNFKCLTSGHHNQSNPHPVPTLKMGLDLEI